VGLAVKGCGWVQLGPTVKSCVPHHQLVVQAGGQDSGQLFWIWAADLWVMTWLLRGWWRQAVVDRLGRVLETVTRHLSWEGDLERGWALLKCV
jgi:hypothetical protein